MTPERIRELAEQACPSDNAHLRSVIERAIRAALVENTEACAKICEERFKPWPCPPKCSTEHCPPECEWGYGAEECAAEIRKRRREFEGQG